MTGHLDVFCKLDMIPVTVQIHPNKTFPLHMLQQVCKMNEHIHLIHMLNACLVFSIHKWYVFWTLLQAGFPSSPIHLRWVWMPPPHPPPTLDWLESMPLDLYYMTSYSQQFGLPFRVGVLKKQRLIPMKVSLQVRVSRQDHSNLNLSLLLRKNKPLG